MFFVKITFSVISGPIILAKVVKNTVDFSEKNLIIHTKLFGKYLQHESCDQLKPTTSLFLLFYHFKPIFKVAFLQTSIKKY